MSILGQLKTNICQPHMWISLSQVPFMSNLISGTSMWAWTCLPGFSSLPQLSATLAPWSATWPQQRMPSVPRFDGLKCESTGKSASSLVHVGPWIRSEVLGQIKVFFDFERTMISATSSLSTQKCDCMDLRYPNRLLMFRLRWWWGQCQAKHHLYSEYIAGRHYQSISCVPENTKGAGDKVAKYCIGCWSFMS